MLNSKSRRKMQRVAMASMLAKRKLRIAPKVHVIEIDKSSLVPNLQQISKDSHLGNVTKFFKGWQKSGQTLILDECTANIVGGIDGNAFYEDGKLVDLSINFSASYGKPVTAEGSIELSMRKFYDVEDSLQKQAKDIAEIARHINFGLNFGITGRFKSGEYNPTPHLFSINLESPIPNLKPHSATQNCDCYICSNPKLETPFLTAREVTSPHRTVRVSQKLYDRVMEIAKQYPDVKVEVPNATDGLDLHHIVPDRFGIDHWDLLNTYPLTMPPPDSNSRIGEMAKTFSELHRNLLEKHGTSQVHDSFSIADMESKAKALGLPLDFVFPVDEDHSARGRMTVTRLKERKEVARKYFLDIGGIVFDPNQHIDESLIKAAPHDVAFKALVDDSLTKPEPYAQMVLTADVIASRVQNFVLRNAVEDDVLVLFVIKERNLRIAAIDALLELPDFKVFSDFVVTDKCKHYRFMPNTGKRIAVVKNCEGGDLCATSQHLMLVDNDARNKSIQTGKAHLDLQSIWRMRFADNENAKINIYGYETTWKMFKHLHYPSTLKGLTTNTIANEELFIRRISENSNTVKGI